MDYIAHQGPLFTGFSRQEYWSWLPCPPPDFSCVRRVKKQKVNDCASPLTHLCNPCVEWSRGWGFPWGCILVISLTRVSLMRNLDLNMYNIMYETSHQSRFEARYWMLGAGALGRPRWRVWGGRREEGSGWGTQIYLWQIHFDIWQN